MHHFGAPAASVKLSHLFYCHIKTIWWIFMKFSGDIDMDLCHTYKHIIAIDINQCCFYGNIIAIPIKLSYILQQNSKTIRSIFMKFSGKIDIVLSFTYNCIVSMDINVCCFYGNKFAMLCQILSCHSLTIVLLLWVSIDVVFIATYFHWFSFPCHPS